MPAVYETGKPFDAAAAASNLPSPFQWIGGAAGSVLKDLTGGDDPASQLMNPTPMMAAETELSPLAKALYSRVQRAVEAMPEWLHPAKALSLLKNNASKEELDYRGVSNLLNNRMGPDKISKGELLDHLEQNPPPDVGVKTLKSGAYAQTGPVANQVQYNRPDLNLPGGKNYTESLFKLPVEQNRIQVKQASPRNWTILVDGHPRGNVGGVTDEATALEQAIAGHPAGKSVRYEAPHFTGEDRVNLLAHTREDIRPDATGAPGKFLQEVQSDWHQAGKENGYKDPKRLADLAEQEKAAEQRYKDIQKQFSKVWEESPEYDALDEQSHSAYKEWQNLRQEMNKVSPDAVPDAPFKESWPDLTLKKHVLDVAKDPNLEWLGFTKGETQNQRYNLAQHVKMLEYDPKDMYLTVYNHDGSTSNHNVSPNELPNWIGKENTQKLLSTPATTLKHFNDDNPTHILQGLDFQMGGEGMKHFYDNVLPSRLGKILKPFGGSVEHGAVQTGKPSVNIRVMPNTFGPEARMIVNNEHVASTWPPFGPNEINNQVALRSDLERQLQSNTAPAWLARITPEMKQAILSKGLPLLTTIMMLRQLANQGQPNDTQSVTGR